jgi:hypothetical protein
LLIGIVTFIKYKEEKTMGIPKGKRSDGNPAMGEFVRDAWVESTEAISNLLNLTNQVFTGVISLKRMLTHYADYTPGSNIAVTLAAGSIIGGSAEIRMIGNGTNTPTFSAFTKSSGSANYDPTLAAINKIVFYYDGTDAFYSITVLE